MKTFICKIPPNLPLPSGSASGSWGPPARRETALGRRPKGGAAVQSRITHFKPGIGTLAPDGIILLRQFIKSPLFPLCQRGKLLFPSLAKRGQPACCLSAEALAQAESLGGGRGRFSNDYVNSILRLSIRSIPARFPVAISPVC